MPINSKPRPPSRFPMVVNMGGDYSGKCLFRLNVDQ
jgi:hypothetical protein